MPQSSGEISTNRLGCFTSIGLPQNADNLFGTVRFASHEYSSIGLRNTHIGNGANSGGHATN